MPVRREAAQEGGQASGAGFGARSQDDRVSGAEGVGGLGDVVAQPADDGDVPVVTDQRRRPARLVREVGRDAVGPGEVTLDGRREARARRPRRGRPGPRRPPRPPLGRYGRMTSTASSWRVRPSRWSSTCRVARTAASLATACWYATPPGSAAEGPDGDGAVETAGAVEEVAPGPGSRFERGDLGDEGGVRTVEQDPVRAVAGPARQTVMRVRRSRGDGRRRTPAAPPRGRPTRRRGRHQVAVTGRR